MKEHSYVEGVLGGGGVKGFCHIGFLKAAEKLDLRFSSLLGVSVGSLVATLHCNGYKPDEIHEIFRDRLRTRLTAAAMNYAPDVSYFQLLRAVLGCMPSPAREAMTAYGAAGAVAKMPAESLQAVIAMTSWYPDLHGPMRDMVKELELKPSPELKILAFDSIERKAVLFEGVDYDLSLALAASCSLPGAFRPVLSSCGTQVLIDGAFWHRNPGEFCKGRALISKLGFASALPVEALSPIEYLGHLKEMLGLTHFHRHEVNPEDGHVVVEMKTPHVAGMSFGISKATQDAMVEYGESQTILAVEEARKNGKI